MSTKTTSHSSRKPGRPTKSRPGWLIPLLIVAVAALVLIGVAIVASQGASSGRAARPISTLNTRDFHSLRFSQTDPATIYFGHHDGLLVSRDLGDTWQPTSLAGPGKDAMSLASSPKAPKRMYAVGHEVFFRSDDGGATWQVAGGALQNADIHAFTADGDDPDRLYGFVVGAGLATSADAGTTWERLPMPPVGGLTALASGPNRQLFAGAASAGVFRSVDGGESWQAFNSGLDGAPVTGLAFNSFDGYLYAATLQGLYRVKPGGSQPTWQPVLEAEPLMAVAVSPHDSRLIVAVGQKGSVFRSRDGGKTWSG